MFVKQKKTWYNLIVYNLQILKNCIKIVRKTIQSK